MNRGPLRDGLVSRGLLRDGLVNRGLLKGVAVSVLFYALAGCAGRPQVTRVYDGHIVRGRYISPEAYAAFMRGILAEESGDYRMASVEFETATREDPRDPEVWLRLGAARCKMMGQTRSYEQAFDRAEDADRAYPSLSAFRSECASLRKQTPP